MSKGTRSSFNMGRSFLLIGIDVVFALVSMMMVIRWRYDFKNIPIEANIDFCSGKIARFGALRH